MDAGSRHDERRVAIASGERTLIDAIGDARSPWTPLLLVLLAYATCWLVIFLAVPWQRQDFPLSDDWAWTKSALRFAQHGEIDYGNWAAMPQLGQWLWSCPFVWLLGGSFTTFRLATAALGAVGIWACYDLFISDAGLGPARAALAAATLAFQPLYFVLAGTFMTDVPAFSFALAALAFYQRAVSRHAPGWLVPAVVLALFGVSTRQNALAAPAAAAFLVWRRPDWRLRPVWLLGVLLPLAAGVAIHYWFENRPDVVHYRPSVPEPHVLLILPFLIVHLFGLAALPLLALEPRVRSWKLLLVALLLLLLAAFYWGRFYGHRIPYGGIFPYWDGLLSPEGVFSPGLVAGERPVLLTPTWRIALSIAGCLAGAVLVARSVERLRSGRKPRALLVFALLELGFILITPRFYDRYLLFLMPGAFALVLAPEPNCKGNWGAALTLAGLLAVLSVCLMHDWFSWNAVRWDLGKQALARRISAYDIEGGFEWDGWYAPNLRLVQPVRDHGLTQPLNRQFFPYVTGRYALSFSPLPGTTVTDSEPYQQWLPPGWHRFYLLRLDTRQPPGP